MHATNIDQFPTINRLLTSIPPARLFHYTDGTGLLGIMKSSSIWASEARYLNDEKEVELAKDYVQNCASNLRQYREASQFTPDEKQLLEELEHSARATRPGVCVVSFSEERDLLSQWRAYGGTNESYCLGLSGAVLRTCAEHQGFVLGQCTYDHGDCYTIAREIIMNLITRYRNSDRSESVKNDLRVRVAVDLATYGPLLKHQSFAEEKEWRIVTPQISIGDPRLHFRSAGGRIVPFAPVELKDCLEKRGREDGTLIVAGPGSHQHLASYAMQALSHRATGPGVGLSTSAAPYRQW